MNLKLLCSKLDIAEPNCKNNISIIEEYNSDDWKKYVKINKITYNKEIVYSNKNFDVCIITWNAKQCCNPHDHADNGCIYKILKGELTEILLNKKNLRQTNTNKLCNCVKTLPDDNIKKSILKLNSVRYIDDNIGLHSICNFSDEYAVSLHIYSPPNYKTKYFHV